MSFIDQPVSFYPHIENISGNSFTQNIEGEFYCISLALPISAYIYIRCVLKYTFLFDDETVTSSQHTCNMFLEDLEAK